MKFSHILKLCLNPKVLIGVGAIIVLAYLFAPQLASYSWLLIFLLCPLSMMLMMVGMNHGHGNSDKAFVCPECNMTYTNAEWAKKCTAWCHEHHSCNLAITKHAVERS